MAERDVQFVGIVAVGIIGKRGLEGVGACQYGGDVAALAADNADGVKINSGRQKLIGNFTF